MILAQKIIRFALSLVDASPLERNKKKQQKGLKKLKTIRFENNFPLKRKTEKGEEK